MLWTSVCNHCLTSYASSICGSLSFRKVSLLNVNENQRKSKSKQKFNSPHFLLNEAVNRMIRKAVEQRTCGNAICSWIRKYKPVATKLLGQLEIPFNDVVRIAGTSPDYGVFHRLSRRFFQGSQVYFDFVCRVHVETLIDAISDVIVVNFFSVFIIFYISRVDVCN